MARIDLVDVCTRTTLFTIRVGEREVHAHAPGAEPHPPGAPVWLTFKRYHVFDKASGLRLWTHVAP